MQITNRKKQTSRFLKILCPRCKNIQTVYGKATLLIKCDNCNKLLAKTTGGKAKIKAKVIEVL